MLEILRIAIEMENREDGEAIEENIKTSKININTLILRFYDAIKLNDILMIILLRFNDRQDIIKEFVKLNTLEKVSPRDFDIMLCQVLARAK
jgi:hypothetical protein